MKMRNPFLIQVVIENNPAKREDKDHHHFLLKVMTHVVIHLYLTKNNLRKESNLKNQHQSWKNLTRK